MLEQVREEFKKAKEKLYQELHNSAEKWIMEKFKPIFNENPDLKSVHVRAYTQYFADGDTCNYSVHNYAESMLFDFGDGPEYGEECERIYAQRDGEKYPVKTELGERIEDAIQVLDDDEYEEVFGDHIEIIITPDGITTEDYSDHD